MRHTTLPALLLYVFTAGCPAPPTDADGGASDDAGPPSDDGGDPMVDASSPDGGDPSALQVRVEQGTLGGIAADGSHAFLGVPYAAPPVGELRWRPPAAPDPWEGVRPAGEMSVQCVQPTDSFAGDGRPSGSSFGAEDCLYLNVWTPAERGPADTLPVMVFLHGGGNLGGSTQDPLRIGLDTESGAPMYDGARLAARGSVVVVTLNYRLGPLGFFSHPALDAEGDNGVSGNQGLMDQIAALEWVQENIGAFGGDPARVLLFGQSGGGRDTLLLATSPLTDGLLSAAALHSAPLGAQPARPARDQAALLVEEMACEGADVLACMRDIDAGDFVVADAAQPQGLASGAFRPIVDGHVVVAQPSDRIAAGLHGVPLLVGTLEDEYSHRWTVPAQTYEARVRAAVGAAAADAVLAQYPVERFADATEAFVTLMSDRNVTCPARTFARVASRTAPPVYLYRFRELLEPDARLGYGAYHTSDLFFLFQHMNGEEFPASNDDREVEALMRRYWTRFASSGDPNGDADPVWSPFDLAEERYLSIEADPWEGQHLKQDDCDFWQGLGR